jgi:hypothetical protein
MDRGQVTQLSESQTHSVAAIRDSCVIPGERAAGDPGSSAVWCKTLDSLPAFAGTKGRGNDVPDGVVSCVIPGERVAGDPGSSGVWCKTLDSRLRGNDGS